MFGKDVFFGVFERLAAIALPGSGGAHLQPRLFWRILYDVPNHTEDSKTRRTVRFLDLITGIHWVA